MRQLSEQTQKQARFIVDQLCHIAAKREAANRSGAKERSSKGKNGKTRMQAAARAVPSVHQDSHSTALKTASTIPGTRRSTAHVHQYLRARGLRRIREHDRLIRADLRAEAELLGEEEHLPTDIHRSRVLGIKRPKKDAKLDAFAEAVGAVSFFKLLATRPDLSAHLSPDQRANIAIELAYVIFDYKSTINLEKTPLGRDTELSFIYLDGLPVS